MSTNAVRTTGADAPFRGRLALAATLTFAAGVIHAAAAVPHFGDDTVLGTAFAVTGWVQILLAALLLRRRPPLGAVWGGVAAHGAALGALVAARTIGLPVGHGGVEPVTLPDATTAVLEAAALFVLVGWLLRPHRLGTSRAVVVGTLGVAGLLAMGGSTWAVADLGTSGHGHGEDAGAPVAGGQDDEHVDPGTDGHHGATGTASDDDQDVHVHTDESVHVHDDGEAHEHADGTVHVHLATSGSEPAPASTAPDSHSHAPGQGHD